MKGDTTKGVCFCVPFSYERVMFIMTVINGKPEAEATGKNLADYLSEKGYPTAGVAVEINGVIIKKSEYPGRVIEEGDVIEIVSFVGGG